MRRNRKICEQDQLPKEKEINQIMRKKEGCKREEGKGGGRDDLLL